MIGPLEKKAWDLFVKKNKINRQSLRSWLRNKKHLIETKSKRCRSKMKAIADRSEYEVMDRILLKTIRLRKITHLLHQE